MTRRACIAAAATLALATSVRASASDTKAGRSLADDVDRRIGQMRVDLERASQSAHISAQQGVSRMDARLGDAEVQFIVGDYLRAAILLIDVVEDPALRTHPRRDEAVFKLAEALRLSGNDRAAWRYYEEVAPRSTGNRLDEVVEGLLELVAKDGRFDDLDRVLGYLPAGVIQARPELEYAYGKALFAAARTDSTRLPEALETFRRVSGTSKQGPRARYYAGVTLVRMNNYPAAIGEFRQVLDLLDPTDDETRPLRELAWLSLGRLHQELGHIEASDEAYGHLQPSSALYSQMLYEKAWTHVRAANQASDPGVERREYERALDATELLMATVPSPTLYPDARILQGNLQIRLGAPETAYQTFESIIDRYGQAQGELRSFLRRSADTDAFFDALVASELERQERPGDLPEIAVEYALEQEGLTRAVRIESDLVRSRKNLAESRELVELLGEALAGEQKYRMFPGLVGPRDQMVSLRARVLTADLALLEMERGLTREVLAADRQAEADRIHAELKRVAAEIRQLPETTDEVEGRRQEVGEVFEKADLRAYQLTYKISGMRAQLVAVRSWLSRNRDTLSDEEQKVMEARIQRSQQNIARLEEQLDQVLTQLRRQRALAQSNATVLQIARLRAQYEELRDQELGVLREARGSVATEVLGLVTRYDQQRQQLMTIQREVDALDARIDGQIRDRVVELQQLLARESVQLQELEARYAQVSGAAQAVLDPVADVTLRNVDSELGELLLRADVGLIDVAWARKQAETERVDTKIREYQEQAQALEAEFADVLSE